ncbi:Signal transduction histidine-protein kinase BarA [Sphingobacterium daejeonense]|nr:Signal transduction histidine-protein kinase BarA [Sphingobacterium daejeonense]
MLGYKGVETTSASNGFEAIQLLSTGKRFDAIIMDYRMPILNGLETIAKIKELFQQNAEQYPIFVLSTSSEDQQYISLFRQEPNSYCLPKPIISEELYRILSQPNLEIAIPIEDIIEENEDEQQIFNEVYDVLIADDNTVNMALNIRLTEEILPNCRIVNVENGFLAVEACKKKQFDLILMDIQMPVMDGLEATKKIKLMPPFQEIPIIGITAGNVSG